MRKFYHRHRNILDFTLASLLRRKAKNISLVLAFTLIVFVLSSVLFFTASIRFEANKILQHAPEIVVQKMTAGRHDLIDAISIDTIKKIRGVSDVKGRIWGYYFDPVAGANYTLIAIDNESMQDGKIIIGSALASLKDAMRGDVIAFKAFNNEIVALEIGDILSYDSNLVSADTVLMTPQDIKKIFGFRDDFYTDIVVSVRNQREIQTIATKILEIMPNTRTISRDEILRTYDSIFHWRSGLMLLISFGAMLAFVIFAWDKGSGLSAHEKQEIGILKAIGWETSDVLIMKFWEGVIVSLSAFLLGTISAYAHVFFFNSSLFEPVLKGWSVLYPNFRLTPIIEIYHVFSLFTLTVLPYTAATIIPSWSAATADPDNVMR